MGIYLNPGNDLFFEAINSDIYIDKSMLIDITNKSLRTTNKHICISRPRRFGKSMAANMLTAYYSRGCDSAGVVIQLICLKILRFQKQKTLKNI